MSDGLRDEPGNELDFDDVPELPEQQGAEEREEAWFPSSVTVAGIIWVILGCLVILNLLLQLGTALMLLLANNGGQGDFYAPGSLSALLFGLLIGLSFLVGGIRSMRGTANDTLGIAAGSIIFSVLEWCVTVFLAVSGHFIEAGFFGSIAAAFLAAAVLALIGRRRYKLWLVSHRSRHFRRLDPDESLNL